MFLSTTLLIVNSNLISSNNTISSINNIHQRDLIMNGKIITTEVNRYRLKINA